MPKTSAIRRLTATGPTWGWLAGIVYFSWVTGLPGHLPFWAYMALIFLGPLFALGVIGGVTGFIAERLTQVTFGSNRNPVFYVLDGLIAAVASFSRRGGRSGGFPGLPNRPREAT